MKTLAQILVVFGFALFVSCSGPNAEQIKNQQRLDSIRIADSLALVQAELDQIADSIAALADSVLIEEEIVVE